MTSPHEALPLDDARAASKRWHDERHAFVTSPLGNLALVLTHWSPAGDEPVSDEQARAGHPVDAVLTRLTRADIDTGETQHGYRIWQTDSPANLAFEGIESYEYDPDWVIDAEFELVADDRVIPFEHLRDAGATRGLPVPGDLVFERAGIPYRLAAFANGDVLQLVFGDATNGVESYGAGRFLAVPRPEIPDGASTGDRVPVTLDFNRAYVPPCGFSSQMNCPLPPPQNRFAVPVRAGERVAVFAEGFTL